jgi:hypothetical protein
MKLTFAAGLCQWRAGFPKTTIEDCDVEVIQATAAGGSRIKFFFDRQPGLLVRTAKFRRPAPAAAEPKPAPKQ